MLVVLTPIDQNLSHPQSLLHVGNYQVGVFLFQQARQRVSEWFCLFVSGGRMQGNINLEALGTRTLGKTLQTQMREDVPQPDADLRALNHISRRTRIKVENNHGRTLDIFGQRERRMQFQRC